MDQLARRHRMPTADRVALVLAVLLLSLQAIVRRPGVEAADGRSFDVLAAALLAGASVAAAAARRAPATGAVAVLALTLTWYQVGYVSSVIHVPFLVAFYFVGASGDRRRQVALAGVAITGTSLAMVVDGGEPTASVASAIGWTVAAVLFGEVTWSRRALLDEYEERARRAEAEREDEAARRVALARLEIARDLHDVLAHSVALMTVQAGVGQDALERGTDGAAAALATIRDTGRDAMREVQALVTVLRDGRSDGPAAPVPGLDRIEELAVAPRAAGIDVDVRVDVPGGAVSDLAQLTAYRVVQEALTNVVKHARATRAAVAVEVTGDDVTVDVRDDGCGGTRDDERAGFGVRGMRERVESAGGRFRAGPVDPVGWQVRAVIPRRRTVAT